MYTADACMGKARVLNNPRREVIEKPTPGAIVWEIKHVPAPPDPRI